MKQEMKNFFHRVLDTVNKPEMRILPGQLAFFLVLSIIPLVALIATIASSFFISMDSLVDLINTTFPRDAAELINQAIGGKDLNLNIVIFYFSAFILASNGPHSMIIGSNLLYKVEDKSLIRRRMKAFLMTVVLVLLFVFLLVVPVFGDRIISMIIELVDKESITSFIRVTYSFLKYPISLFFIFFCVKLLYIMAPDKHISSKYTTYGALFTTITWILSTEVYSFYVEVFAKYNLLYGSIANLIILLLWVYLLSYVFVFGMALNASGGEHEKKKVEK